MLSKSLELGSCGVQWQVPDGAIGEHSDSVLAIRADNGLVWRIQLHAVEFAIAPGEEGALSEDLYLSTRAAFELRWAAKPRAAGAQPRSATGAWSPLVDAKLGAIGNGRIARCVRRLAYEQGEEAVAGSLFVPVEKGTVEIRVAARSAEVGAREQAIAQKHGGKQEQAVYDGRELDAYFPNHPLSRVRAALDQVVESLEIVTVPTRVVGDEVALPEAGAAITPPARFVAGPTTAGTNRGEIVRLGVDGWRRTIHVWRVGRPKLKGKDMHVALVEHADKDAQDWAKDGASEIRSRSAPIDDYGVCQQIQQYVSFERDGDVRHAVHRWWISGDGNVWRIGSEAHVLVDRQAMLDELAAVQESFRRL